MTLFFPEDSVLYNNAMEMISLLGLLLEFRRPCDINGSWGELISSPNDGDRPWCDDDAYLVQLMADRIVELNRIILMQSIRIAELNRKPDDE